MKPPDKVQLPVLYSSMRSAIDACHRIDECKEIIDRSAALATYFQQVQDDDSLRKINDIRFRGWRRMGDILRTVDTSKCSTQSEIARKCRDEIASAMAMTDNYIIRALKLAAMTPPAFEKAIKAVLPSGSVDRLIRSDPAHQKEQAERQARYEREQEERMRKWKARQAEEEARRAARQARQAKKTEHAPPLRRVEFWLKQKSHDRLREIARRHTTSVPEIIRRGLNMWLEEHGEQSIPGAMLSGREQSQ